MQRTPIRWWRRAAGLLAVVPLVTGCTSTSSVPVEKPVSAPVAHDDFVLPADAYAFTVPETGQIDLARELLAGRCMQRFGYAFDAKAAREAMDRGSRGTLSDLGYYGNKRRYGVTDATTAARYGYHLISHVMGAAPDVSPDTAPGLGPLTDVMKTVLTGGKQPSGRVNGHQVPQGGCTREAADDLSPSGVLSESDVVAEVGGQSYRDSFAAPAVVAAFKQWSSCMRGRGYPYQTPRDAGAEFDVNTETVPPAEIAAAEADVTCKQQTHLVDIWRGYEVDFQNARIKADAAAFQTAKKAHDARMKRVADVLNAP